MPTILKIEGQNFSDERGGLTFFNTLNMKPIKRFYEISPSSTNVIRAWQGHLKEKKWFYCTNGEFIINLVKLDNKGKPIDSESPKCFILTRNKPLVLELPGGYASGFKATKKNSTLMVFSDSSLEDSKDDDFRFPIKQWKSNWNLESIE